MCRARHYGKSSRGIESPPSRQRRGPDGVAFQLRRLQVADGRSGCSALLPRQRNVKSILGRMSAPHQQVLHWPNVAGGNQKPSPTCLYDIDTSHRALASQMPPPRGPYMPTACPSSQSGHGAVSVRKSQSRAPVRRRHPSSRGSRYGRLRSRRAGSLSNFSRCATSLCCQICFSQPDSTHALDH